MGIQAEENKTYIAINNRLSSTQVVNNESNGIFRNITDAERLAGIIITEKIFFKVDNLAGIIANNVLNFISNITPAGSHCYMQQSDQRTGSATGNKYGCGELNTSIAIGANTLIVDVESGNGINSIFTVGDNINILDRVLNISERAIIDTVSFIGDQATITITGTTDNAYPVGAIVSSGIVTAQVKTSVDSLVVSSANGSLDISQIELNNLGTTEQTFTHEFTSTTAFNVIGDTLGVIGTGNTAGDFEPINADFALMYYKIPTGAWSGSFEIADTFTFDTHPAAVPIIATLVVPAGTTDELDNITLRTKGEG